MDRGDNGGPWWWAAVGYYITAPPPIPTRQIPNDMAAALVRKVDTWWSFLFRLKGYAYFTDIIKKKKKR